MKPWMLELCPLWIATAILWLAVGCSTVPYYEKRPDGSVKIGEEVSFLGIPMYKDIEITPSPADAIAEAKTAHKIHDILAPGKREDKAFGVWLGAGALCLLISIGMLVAAWAFSGWKRFGIGAAVFFGAGVAFTGTALSVQWFWLFVVGAVGGAVIGAVAWLLRNHKLLDVRKVNRA